MDDNFLDLHKNFLNWYYEPPLTGVKPGLTGTALSCPSKVTPSEPEPRLRLSLQSSPLASVVVEFQGFFILAIPTC